MLFEELFEGEIVMEFGQHGFGGYGRGIFRRAAYEKVATWLGQISDADIREHLTAWFNNAFQRDNSAFKPHAFTAWVEARKHTTRSMTWQQRHFWYFAHLISQISDTNERDYLARWLGDKLDRETQGFRNSLWDSACGLTGSDPQVARRPNARD